LTWENADHVLLEFPDGIAEMADRAGLRLTVAGTAHPGWRPPYQGTGLKALWASVREWRLARRAGIAPSVTWLSPIDIMNARLRRSSQIGESAIYVLTKPA